MDKDKILFLITKSNWGGAQKYVFDLSTRLSNSGRDVVVAFGGTGEAGATPGLLHTKLAAVGIRTLFITNLRRNMRLFGELMVLKEIVGILRKERPTVVHLNSSKVGGIGAFAARLCGVRRIIYTIHGWPFRENRPLLSRIGIRIATWLSVVLAHEIIVLTKNELTASAALPFSSKKMHLIHNGVTELHFLNRADCLEAICKTAGINKELLSNKFIVGTIAELHPNKNLPLLIEAVAATEEKDISAIIIGEGEEHSKLKEMISTLKLGERIFLTGHIPEAAKYMKAFDCFALTSNKEGLPYVLLEAGQAGVAIVATDCGGVTDVVGGNCGLLVTPDDRPALVHSIESIKSDKAGAERRSQNLKTRIGSTFSFEKMILETKRLYENR